MLAPAFGTMLTGGRDSISWWKVPLVSSQPTQPRRCVQASYSFYEEMTMCRWLAYSGNSVPMSRLVYEPEHSLIDQLQHYISG